MSLLYWSESEYSNLYHYGMFSGWECACLPTYNMKLNMKHVIGYLLCPIHRSCAAWLDEQTIFK